MWKIVGILGAGRLIAVVSLFGIALIGVLAVPFVAAAGVPGSIRPQNAPTSVDQCRERVAREDPRRDSFFDELVTDDVISAEQAAEIDARLDAKHFDACVARILWERGNAIDATASATSTTRREVIGALIAGQSFSEYANDLGVDDATLIDAIMAGPTAKAAELVDEGQLSQAEVDAILARIEERVSECIHMTDISPRKINQQLELAADAL